jgi:hypothetical protein
MMPSGFSAATLLQKISVFLSDFEDGQYVDYTSLISSHPITN